MIELFNPVFPRRGIAKVHLLEPTKESARKLYEREWYRKNRERLLARMKARYEMRKEEYIAKAKEWAAKNPEKARQIKRRSKLRRKHAPY